MRKLVYYVASSIDGFICGPQGEIDMFVHYQDVVDHYMRDLQDFDTVIMGRKTYEFGYAFGLQAGQPAYPHMYHYIFSSSLEFEETHEKVQVVDLDISIVGQLKKSKGTDIYLCGGGMFAEWLLGHKMIDQLKVKMNPILLGEGIRLFGDSTRSLHLKQRDLIPFESGVMIITFDILY